MTLTPELRKVIDEFNEFYERYTAHIAELREKGLLPPRSA